MHFSVSLVSVLWLVYSTLWFVDFAMTPFFLSYLDFQLKYKTWLWWTRFAMVITVLQFIGATYLMFRVAKFVSRDGMRRDCVLGKPRHNLH